MYAPIHRFFDDFQGKRIIGSTATDGPWVFTKNGSGSPTANTLDGATSAVRLLLDNTSEAQAIDLSHGDIKQWRAEDIEYVRFRLKVPTADITTAQTLSFGLSGNRNNTWHSRAQYVNFALQASTALLLESLDGTTTNNAVATDTTVTTALGYREFAIDFTQGLADVRFLAGDASNHMHRLAPKTTFNCAALKGLFLQPSIQIQKASGTTTPAVDVDYVEIVGRRS